MRQPLYQTEQAVTTAIALGEVNAWEGNYHYARAKEWQKYLREQSSKGFRRKPAVLVHKHFVNFRPGYATAR